MAALVKETDRAYLTALRACGSESLADEAVQEAYIRLLKRPPKDQGYEKSVAYFLKMVRGIAIDLVRTSRHRKRREEAHAMSPEAPSPTPEDVTLSREAIAAARTALSDLPGEEREAVSLCCEQGLTQRVAGDVLGVAEQTISDRVKRGLQKLRSVLVANGYAAVGPMGVLALGDALKASGVPAAPTSLVTAIEKIVSKSLASKAGALSSAARAASSGSTSSSVFAISAIVIGTVAAGAWWVSSTSAPKPTIAPPAKPAAVKPLPAMKDPKILARWDFNKGPSDDLYVREGEWSWSAGADGEPGSMMAEKPVSLLLPTMIPKQPVVVEVDARPLGDEQFRQYSVELTGVRGGARGRTWLKNWGRKLTLDGKLKSYFLGGHSIHVAGTKLFAMTEYEEPYPGYRFTMYFNRWSVRSIEIRLLGPNDVPQSYADPKKMIPGMEFGPVEADESIIDAVRRALEKEKAKKMRAGKNSVSE